jgi:hypothetical protein
MPIVDGFKPLNMGLLVDCITTCSTSYGQILTELPTILFFKHIGHWGGESLNLFFLSAFFLMPTVDGFKPLNMGLLVDCITNCATTYVHVLTKLLTITFFKRIG